MPYIVVLSDPPGPSRVIYRERVEAEHLDSCHAVAQLAQRLGRAVSDAALPVAAPPPARSWTTSEP